MPKQIDELERAYEQATEAIETIERVARATRGNVSAFFDIALRSVVVGRAAIAKEIARLQTNERVERGALSESA